VIDVLFKNDVSAATAALQRVSRAAHRLEILEARRESIVAIGLLFVKCRRLVAALSGEDEGSADISRLRAEISTDYWGVVDSARERLGMESFAARQFSDVHRG
jgi:hypothetical protein